MLSSIDIENTKRDVVKVTTLILVSHILSSKVNNVEMFNQTWLHTSLATLIGFTVHGLYTSRFNKLKIFSNLTENQKTSLKDVIKFGTVFLVQYIASNIITDQDFSMMWIKTHVTLLLGYVVFNMVILGRLQKREQPFSDIIKISSVILFSDVTDDGVLNIATIPKLIFTWLGLFVYHKYVKLMTFN